MLHPQRRDMLAQIPVGEAPREQTKQEQGGEEHQHSRIPETQGRGALLAHLHRLMNRLKGRFAQAAIMADSLDVQQTSVGVEADLAQGAQVLQPFADGEVSGVINGGLCAQGSTLFVVLLDARVLVSQCIRKAPRPR